MAKAVQKLVRKPWTKQDDRSLKQLVRAKTPLTRIARELKRTAAAVRGRASKLVLSLDIRVKKKKTKAKTATKTRTVKTAKSVKAKVAVTPTAG
jgi:hypothetical protein